MTERRPGSFRVSEAVCLSLLMTEVHTGIFPWWFYSSQKAAFPGMFLKTLFFGQLS